VKLLYLLTTLNYFGAPTACYSTFYKIQPTIQAILRGWLPLHANLVLNLTPIRFTASFVLSTVYAYEQKGEDDHIIVIIRRHSELLTAALGTGATVIMETFSFRTFDMTIGI